MCMIVYSISNMFMSACGILCMWYVCMCMCFPFCLSAIGEYIATLSGVIVTRDSLLHPGYLMSTLYFLL